MAKKQREFWFPPSKLVYTAPNPLDQNVTKSLSITISLIPFNRLTLFFFQQCLHSSTQTASYGMAFPFPMSLSSEPTDLDR